MWKEDKIIREKLDKLDGLPEGYEPNLNSKWELLEAGLSGTTERRTEIYFKISAAAVITLIVVTSILMNLDRDVIEKVQVVEKPEQPASMAPVKKDTTEKIVKPLSEPVKLVQEEIKQPASSYKLVEIHQNSPDNEKTHEAEIFDPEEKGKSELANVEPVNEPEQNENVDDSQLKRRYVQMDFSDPVVLPDKGPDRKALAFDFKLNLMRSNTVRTASESSTSSGSKGLFNIEY